MVLALQGGMAVGKTTAARYTAAHASAVTVFFEDNAPALAALRGRGLDKHKFADYCEIQRAFIQQELDRYALAAHCPCALLDLGPQEIEFYTLYYPHTLGQDWPVEQALAAELASLRRCRINRTLFLHASVPVLRQPKEADATRDRGFFDYTVQHLLPAKERWFAAQPLVDFLQTDRLTQAETAAAVLAWGNSQGRRAGLEPAPTEASPSLAGKSLIDVGTGAGFPGLVLKILEPSLRLTLLDSLGKRVNWLASVCDTLGLEGVECLHARAEEQALVDGYRDGFDYAVSRAVASLELLCELCLPYLKVGGRFLAMKGVDSGEEINHAARCISILGGRLLPSVDYVIPGANVRHRVVLVEKCTPTPNGYPRRWAKIQKAPL